MCEVEVVVESMKCCCVVLEFRIVLFVVLVFFVVDCDEFVVGGVDDGVFCLVFEDYVVF